MGEAGAATIRGGAGGCWGEREAVWRTGIRELTVEDLREMVRMLDLIPIPERVLPQVLDAVREQRAAVRRFAESGVEVDETLTAQPYRLEEGTP